MKRHPIFRICILLAILASSLSHSRAEIPALPTASTALVGYFSNGPIDLALAVDETQFINTFGSADPTAHPAELQARRFFDHGGGSLIVVRVADDQPLLGRMSNLSGLHAAKVFEFRLLLIPEITRLPTTELRDALTKLQSFADDENLFVILDPPSGWETAQQAADWVQDYVPDGASGMSIYWPYIRTNLDGIPIVAGASGAMAALYAQNDAANEIWDSPSGQDLRLIASAIEPAINNAENEILNQAGICAIRQFVGIGIVPWGARTLDPNNNEQRYIPIARTLRWIDASIQIGTAFAASADNNQATWDQILSDSADFLADLYSRGAFPALKASDAYFLKLGEGITMTAQDVADGIAILEMGLAFVRPAEFIFKTHRFDTYNPSTPLPTPSINIREHDSKIHISFPTTAGFTYQFQSSDDLQSFSIGTPLPGDGTWLGTNVNLSFAPARKFYRVKVRSAR